MDASHYLTMKLYSKAADRVYEEFKLYHLNCEFELSENCSDLLEYAKYYTNIVFGRILTRI